MTLKQAYRANVSLLGLGLTLSLNVTGALAQTNATAEAPLEEVVVTGFRQSLNAALDIKRQQAVMVDAIVAEDIAKFPDKNLAESLQRVPGITLDRGDGGEGKRISVRGLSADFTRVRLNGMEAAALTGSSDAEGGTNRTRSFDFQCSALRTLLQSHCQEDAVRRSGGRIARRDRRSGDSTSSRLQR